MANQPSSNPGPLINVPSETYGNPDPNGGTAQSIPRELDLLTDANEQGYPLAPEAGETFPTPEEVIITGVPPLLPSNFAPVPAAATVNVDEQTIGQGTWQFVDPLNPPAGKNFVPPSEFIVVGPAESFQTNLSQTAASSVPGPAQTVITVTIVTVTDADYPANIVLADASRYRLTLDAPLTNLPVSMLGRQIVFTPDTLTSDDAGATRAITGYNTSTIVINKSDPTDLVVPDLVPPATGDTFTLNINRQGSELVNTTGPIPATFNIDPVPPKATPNQATLGIFSGNPNVSSNTQPSQPIIELGTVVSTARFVEVPDQCAVVGIPTNVFV